MDKQEQQEVPSLEKNFCDNRVITLKDNRAGKAYSIHEGLPRETYADGLDMGAFEVPLIPHVFSADNFKVRINSQNVVDENNVTILYLHGVTRDGHWVPLEKSLNQSGITIEDIVKDLEEQSDMRIDVLFVCNPRPTTRVRFEPFSDISQLPRVFMRVGDAKGHVVLDKRENKVLVEMRTDSEEKVEYKKWKNTKGKVKLVD